MNPLLRFGVLALLAALFACGGNKDNSEPPALLTDIEDRLPLEVNWKLDTRAAANRASYRLRPLLLGDLLYTIDTSGSVVCIDPESGKRQWRFDTEVPAIAGLGGDAENLLVSSRDGEILSYRIVEEALELRWQTRIGSEIRATPVLDGRQIFVRSVDGKLRSLSTEDGSLQWVVSQRVPSLSLTGTGQPLVAGGIVFSGFDDGKLIAFDRSDGKIRWESTISQPSGRTEVERLVDLDGNFVLRDGVIYIASFQGRLAAVQAVSGDLLWSRQFSSYQSIDIDDDALYLSSDDSHLWAIDRRTGASFWMQDVLHARKITGPTLYGDNLLVADLDGYLHWFDKKDGRLIGRIRTSDFRNYVRPLIWRSSILTLDKAGLLASVSSLQ